MGDVTQILSRLASGEAVASDELFPLVYDELRRLASAKLAHEKPGHTLQATALVHEAYLRLVGANPQASVWDGRGHFFAAAAEAMRRILIDRARQKARQRRGGSLKKLDIDAVDLAFQASPDQLLIVDEALERLRRKDPDVFELVRLRYFAGMTIDQAAKVLGISVATAYRHWSFARAWLHGELLGNGDEP